MPCQPGRMPSASSSPVASVDRRGEAHADAEQAVARRCRRCCSASRTSSCGEVEALGRRVVDLGRRPVVDDRLRPRDRRPRRGCAGGRSRGRPRTPASGRARAGSAGGRCCAAVVLGRVVLLDDAGAARAPRRASRPSRARGPCAARARPGSSPDGGRASRSRAAGSSWRRLSELGPAVMWASLREILLVGSLVEIHRYQAILGDSITLYA